MLIMFDFMTMFFVRSGSRGMGAKGKAAEERPSAAAGCCKTLRPGRGSQEGSRQSGAH